MGRARRSRRDGETEHSGSSQVYGAGEAMSDRGGAGRSREPGGAVRPMVPGGAEEGRSQGEGAKEEESG